MGRDRRTFLFTALALAAAGLRLLARAAEAPRIRLLIIEGISNHDWPRRLALVREILARDGAFEVNVSITPPDASDPAAWSRWRPDFTRYDVVLSGYNNLGGKPGWPAEVQRAFEAFVRGGGGFYVYHEANNAFAEWPQYNEMIGLGWRDKHFGSALLVREDETLQTVPAGDGDDTWHGDRTDTLVHQRGQHPIHAGLPRSWRAADMEVYRYARGPARNVDVIAYAHDGVDGRQFPVEWTVRYGRGRVFVSAYGHVWFSQGASPGMRCAAFQTVMPRALKWLAGRDPEARLPADFPGTDTISLRP
ncbi:ThuA domain-containing protein [Roseateles sp. P5_E11]